VIILTITKFHTTFYAYTSLLDTRRCHANTF